MAEESLEDQVKQSQSDNEKGQKALRIIGVVSSIVGLVSFALFIYVTVRNRVLEKDNRTRTQQFLAASDRFTATLNSREAQLRQTTDRLEMQAQKITEQSELLRSIEQRLQQLQALQRQTTPAEGISAPAPLQTLWDQ